jgi:DnaA family protein
MQLPLPLIEPPMPDLRDGAVGQNSAALAALRAMAEGQPQAPDRLFLWGAPGCGKSFWLKAWATTLGTKARLVQCGQKDGGSVASEILAGIAEMGTPEAPQLWLIDDVDQIDQDTASALFQLYNAALEFRHRLVATAGQSPLRLSLREDLRTRLGQGLIFALQDLSDEEKQNALRERAQRLGMPLSEDVLTYLFTRQSRDLGHLTGILDALNQFALSRQRPATIPLLKSLLDSLDATRPV